MYFKSLELIGFKSFAEKTKLNFEPGVTAVVGPNGCGKSNIADGIRWVLGEQSAKSLRASNMQDVIFNGTDTKEPINFAEVSLTFSNEKRILPIDYDEVTITRRIFRSGDTEYLLNKTPVRLKDISELLMGTGIGTESYSIIEQGKIDLILSSKPEDRRYVFEEASGITKYKAKKKEALRKLEQTEQNLLRINDIVLEVKRHISSIERQAKKAEKYKVDFDKLKELEVKLSAFEYKGIKTQEATYSVENEDLKVRIADYEKEVYLLSEKIASYRQSLDRTSQKISDMKTHFTETSGSLDMNIHKIQIDKERVEETRQLQEGLKKEMTQASDKIASARIIIAKLREDLNKVASEKLAKQKSIDENELLLNNLAKEIESADLQVKTCKVEIVDYLAKETRIKNDLIKLGADVHNRKARARRLSIEKETVAKELSSLAAVLVEVEREFKSIYDKASGLREELDDKKDLSARLAAETKTLEEDILSQRNKLVAIKSKIELLEDSIKRYEGFKRGVKSLLLKFEKDRASFGGVIGVLADIIKVERGYEEAVSAFLGEDAQIIVTEKDSDISTIIECLQKENLGKAGFISLETINRFKARAESLKPVEVKALIPLAKFVRIDSRLDTLRQHFFSGVYLAESLEDGIRLFPEPESVTVVTKTGAVYDKGKISDGSASESEESLLIGRKDRLEDLKIQAKRIEDMLKSLEVAHGEKSETNKGLKAAMGSIEENLHKEDINLANIKSKKDTQEEAVKKLKEELELLESETEETDETMAELTSKGEELNSELNNIEKDKSLKESYISESQSLVSNKRAEKERITLEVTTLKPEMQSLEKEEGNARQNLKAQEAILFEAEETLYSKENLLKESADKIRSLEEEASNLTTENEGTEKDLAVLNQDILTFEKAKSEAIYKLSLDETLTKSKGKEVELLRNQSRDLDVKLTELNYKKTNSRDRIMQAYKVEIENTHVEPEDNVDWDNLKFQVNELKDRLDKMGPVNLVAIDEHKELEERHSFLVHQQEDLTTAKDSLLKAIQKINKTTKDMFIETFQKIQVEFKNFFRLLFGGGQAELVLIDEQDILESGIEIIVRPPGKKHQNIMLLSGGEKALTAIALLFSIFKVRPSPFCVLDEIDAPLDESNITRFSNVLKDFLRISQFIIITHNKRTIELADVMYGITMQERGVSKIVSVKFLDEKKEVESVPAEAVAA